MTCRRHKPKGLALGLLLGMALGSCSALPLVPLPMPGLDFGLATPEPAEAEPVRTSVLALLLVGTATLPLFEN